MSDMGDPGAMPPAAPAEPTAGGRAAPASDTSKLLAALGYPIPIVAIIAILIEPYKDEYFVKFHAFQAIGLLVLQMVLAVGGGIVGVIPFIGWIISIVAYLLWMVIWVYTIVLAIQAYGGKYTEVPVVYGFVKQYIG